jgi:hypothetical protein
VTARKRERSTLPKEAARRRYIEIGELVALEQIRKDAKLLDGGATAIGPFARLDANAVAARDGKTRGTISNLFGSQAAFQAETMALALNADEWVDGPRFPAPADFPRPTHGSTPCWPAGPRAAVHGAKPTLNDGFLWALWLGTYPMACGAKRSPGPA